MCRHLVCVRVRLMTKTTRLFEVVMRDSVVLFSIQKSTCVHCVGLTACEEDM